MLRQHGHQVDVFMHAWTDVASLEGDSWSHHFKHTDPTNEIINSYSPTAVLIESWAMVRPEIVAQVDEWRRIGLIPHFTHYGMPGMWRSIQSAFKLISNPAEYDLFIRMRFDCLIREFPPKFKGWSVPEAQDFGGVNDQFAWHGDSDPASLHAYFGLYSMIENLLRAGAAWSPEHLLAKSFELAGVTPNRPALQFSIHND